MERDEAIFEQALRLPVAERASFLEQACAGDAELRERVEKLVAADERAEQLEFLGPTPPASAENRPAAGGTMKNQFTDAPDETVGQKIGRYKLREKIGEGGCGVVYVAEQEEPVRRRVALKVVKLGMDTKQVVARFEAERQALALMDHPNIAKVLDAGATDTGRPYFVMELVRGIRITDYSDKNSLSTEARLKLFIQVCSAIQHAHQKGIIHRDIKPSNILVTLHDSVPVPKVIDFGIAKATTDQRLTDKTIYTAFEQFIGTPAYMSPEQAEMSGLDVDTRSDIYSLGVLLYELLTGKTPFDPKELMESGLDAMRKTIRETEPLKPSTKVHTLQGEELTTTARRRSVDTSKLLHQLKGDLDWIVMKCLEKDRTRRYETANGLAMDLKRHLNNETVVARPPSKLYEFQKTFRRHKVGFAATATVIVVLFAGVLVSTWQAIRATRASRKNKQTVQFLSQMFDNFGRSVEMGRDPTLMRENLDKTVESMSQRLAGQPEAEANLRNQLGWIYRELGEYSKAEDAFRRALKLRTQLGNENDQVVASLNGLGWTYWSEHNRTDAKKCFTQALHICQELHGDDSLQAAESRRSLALLLQGEGNMAKAAKMQREVLAIRRTKLGETNAEVASSLFGLGGNLWYQGNYTDAEKLIQKSLSIRRKLPGGNGPGPWNLMCLGYVQQHLGKLTNAEANIRKALKMQEKLLPTDNHNRALAASFLAVVLEKEGSTNKSLVQYLYAADHGIGFSQAHLGRLYASGRGVPQDLVKAKEWYGKAIKSFRPRAEAGEAGPRIDLAWLLATCDVQELRNGTSAVNLVKEAGAGKSAYALEALAAAYAETGDFDNAVKFQKRARDVLTPDEKREHLESVKNRLTLYEAGRPCRDSQQTDMLLHPTP